jgi:hypothetical protein
MVVFPTTWLISGCSPIDPRTFNGGGLRG